MTKSPRKLHNSLLVLADLLRGREHTSALALAERLCRETVPPDAKGHVFQPCGVPAALPLDLAHRSVAFEACKRCGVLRSGPAKFRFYAAGRWSVRKPRCLP